MLRVALGTQNRMYLRTDRDTMSFLKASLLQDTISGFRAGHKALLKVRYVEAGRSVYHQYEGGPIWMATAPDRFGRPGQRLTISPKLLTRSEFANGIRGISMTKGMNFSWLPTECKIIRISDKLGLHVETMQQPSLEGITRFVVSMEPAEDLGFVPGLGCYLEAKIVDFFSREREVRIYHNGHSQAWLGLRQGKRYARVSLLSFDGVRLRIAYGSPQIRVASIYLANPSSAYSIERTSQEGRAFLNPHWNPIGFYRINLCRESEREMLRSRYRYPHGRIGSEIAYAIASHELGLNDLILKDPSEGGADMMTRDGRIVFESRLVTITEAMSSDLIERQILFQVSQLKTRLQSDLSFYRTAIAGYAFLSYVDLDGLWTMMFEMKRN